MKLTLPLLSAVTACALYSGTATAAAPAEAIEDKDLAGYLFTYFTGNNINQEQIHFALSQDGYNFYALNDNMPVLDSKAIASTGGLRDPHILRAEDGSTFYMVATDMVSDNGWDSNRAFVMMKSHDLVNWESHVVNLPKKYPHQERLKRVWAPQTIHDPATGRYMVYLSLQYDGGPDVICYVWANEDFTDVVGEFKPLFVPANGKSCIDGDIVLKDGVYHLFYKTEGHGNGIKLATTTDLTSGQWTEHEGYKQLTDDSVEGAGTFKLIGQDRWILMYDVYMKGRYQFTVTDDLDNFTLADGDVSMNFHPRHGTVIPVTRAEMQRLWNRWPSNVKGNLDIAANPVLPGFHADPEILHSRRDGLYYIYSTTDGQPGWGGTYYTCYSSPDLIDWTYRGIVLDLVGDQVKWADGNCWAPAIEEKLIDGRYKYFLYFSGNPVAGGGKQIGIAVADDPTGPFTDLGHPIITSSPAGHGQEIDVDVFTDPVSGKSYLYWGNGYMAGAQLNKEMTGIVDSTLTVMTPAGGTLKTWEYREAPYVFWKDGTYYFTWSVDDTGSPNYHVAYGTSTSPLGPIKVAKQPVILSQDAAKGIYGTAHNSIVYAPAQGGWKIVYHRINPGYLNDAPGIHREVCIDALEFNPDGTIRPVTPTR